jgi:hypothetical protein
MARGTRSGRLDAAPGFPENIAHSSQASGRRREVRSISPATACDAHAPTGHPGIDRPRRQMQKIVSQRGIGPRATSSRNARATSSESAR